MKLEELQRAWRAGNAAVPADAKIEGLTRATRDRVTRYRHQVGRRIVFGSIAFCLALVMLAAVASLPGVWLGMRIATGLWAAALVACLAGLWRLRERRPANPVPIRQSLETSLGRLQREVDYHRSLRWRWWLPFTAGLMCALVPRLSWQPGIDWLALLVAVIGCIWGMWRGPDHWPVRLRPEIARLQTMLDQFSAEPTPPVET